MAAADQILSRRGATPERLTWHFGRALRALLIAGLLAWAPALASSAAAESNRTLAGILYDAAIERPIGLAETALGVGVAGIAYPLSLGSGSSDIVLERCVSSPARYTFKRALGRFESRQRSSCSPVGFSWTLVRMSFSVIERPLGLIFGDSPLGDERPDRRREEIEVDDERSNDGPARIEI
jgi:hypothetical protein